MTGKKQDSIEAATRVGLCDLTPTQLKVLEGVNSGLLNKQIAFDLGITQRTIKGQPARRG